MIFVFTALILFLSFYLWKYRFVFNRDLLKDFSDNDVPLLRFGFGITFFTPVEILAFIRAIAQKYKKSYRINVFWRSYYNILCAEGAEKILSSSKHLEKGDIYELLHPFLKTGLLTSEGDKWHTRRRMLTPAFHFDILKEYFEIFKEEGDKLVESLKPKVDKIVDIVPISTQFTLNTVCESAMGVKLGNFGNNGLVYRENIYKLAKFLVDRITKPWLQNDFTYSLLGHQRKFMKVLAPIHEFTQSIVDARRKEFIERQKTAVKNVKDDNENIYMTKKKRSAMMDTLLQAQSEGLIDDEGIIEETDTFTFEGHDTTSGAMTFTLLLLAHHPEVQAKLLEEIEDVLDGRDELHIDDMNKMNYMERVLKESLRIYPPVHFITRALAEDFTNDGITYPKGSFVNIFIYDLHRDEKYFPDPEKFDPDRFLPENCDKRHNFAFLGFSAGMRNCIGQRFAMHELKVMLTKIILNFNIHAITKREDIIFVGDIVLRANHPIKMKFTLR